MRADVRYESESERDRRTTVREGMLAPAVIPFHRNPVRISEVRRSLFVRLSLRDERRRRMCERQRSRDGRSGVQHGPSKRIRY